MSRQVKAKKRSFSGPPDPIVCEKCQVTFSMRKSLYAHMRNIHAEDVVPKGTQICAICYENFLNISQLHEHLQIVHNVELKFSTVTFYCEEDFLQWKIKVEKEDQSSFIMRSSKKKDCIKFSYYACHRSGFFNPKKKRNRDLKKSGSIKIGCTCPATMKVSSQTVNEAIEITVIYQSVHVGHEKELDKLRLSIDEKLKIASSLTQGVPMSKILEETRKQCSPTNRCSLIKRRDLHNIKKSLLIKDNKDDAASVDLSENFDNLESKRNKIFSKLEELKTRLLECKSEDALKFTEERIDAINAYINISKYPIQVPKVEIKPANKLTEEQRKKSKMHETERLKKSQGICKRETTSHPAVKDLIQYIDGSKKIVITKELMISAVSAHQKYKAYLDQSTEKEKPLKNF